MFTILQLLGMDFCTYATKLQSSVDEEHNLIYTTIPINYTIRY